MSPRFNNGDYLLLTTLGNRLRPHQCLVYRHPHYGAIFKQLLTLSNDGRFYLGSLNKSGIGPEQIGECERDRIVGKLLWHIKR